MKSAIDSGISSTASSKSPSSVGDPTGAISILSMLPLSNIPDGVRMS
jgi:hypothetical protein